MTGIVFLSTYLTVPMPVHKHYYNTDISDTDDYDSERPLYEFRSNAFGVGGAGVVGFNCEQIKSSKIQIIYVC